MAKKETSKKLSEARWMTECDVIRYNLRMPQDLKEQLKAEASEKQMDTSTYICGLLSGDIKRRRPGK